MVGHIGQQLDGIIAKRADAPYRPGDDHSTVKIKNYRSADCVIDGFRDHVIGSARNELLLGLYDQKGHLRYVSSVGIDAKQKQQVGMLKPKKTTTFYGRQPEEKSHWGGEAAGPWKPVVCLPIGPGVIFQMSSIQGTVNKLCSWPAYDGSKQGWGK